MRILLDTDILLDVALKRPAFVDTSAEVLRWASRSGTAAIAWHSISNCAYLLKDQGRPFLIGLLELVQVAPTSHDSAHHALQWNMPDIEDALQAAAALTWKADLIVTRNLKHYKNSPVPAVTPSEFLKRASSE